MNFHNSKRDYNAIETTAEVVRKTRLPIPDYVNDLDPVTVVWFDGMIEIGSPSHERQISFADHLKPEFDKLCLLNSN